MGKRQSRNIQDEEGENSFHYVRLFGLNFEEGHVFLDGFLDEDDGFVHSAPYFAAGCVFVASAAEEFGRHLVAWKVVNGTERDTDTGVLGIFAKEDREFDAKNLEW